MKQYDTREAIGRIFEVTGAETYQDLATELGITQPSVAYVVKRNKGIPPGWMLTLLCSYSINPQWIMYGPPQPKTLIPAADNVVAPSFGEVVEIFNQSNLDTETN